MDILGFRTFFRGAWKYLKGTGRESRVALDSINRLRNANEDPYVETDPRKIIKNARGAAGIFLAAGIFFILASFFTLNIVQLKFAAVTTFIVGVGFAIAGCKAFIESEDIQTRISRGEQVR